MNTLGTESISKYLRGFAITGIFIENYLSWVPINSSAPIVTLSVKYIEFLGASLVHIFFFLSGYGLLKKFQDTEKVDWRKYAVNRFSMIIVPYWIVVTATYLSIDLLHNLNPGVFKAYFNVTDWLSYLFFVRNFNRSAWGLNPVMWFMQVLVGLYVAFPFLYYLLKRYGLKKFLILSALIAYSARVVFWWYGSQPSRESSLFLFYIFEFSVGLAFARISVARQIGLTIGSVNVLYFAVAVAGYACSYILKEKIKIIANLHEVFTFFGSVALGIFSYQLVSWLKGDHFEKWMMSLGNAAFIIYLIHAPPIQHVIKPILKEIYHNHQGVFLVSALLVVYFIAIALISSMLVGPFKTLSQKIEKSMIGA